MEAIRIFCQVVIALGILNVWIFRFDRATGWRGGDASNMREEFAMYGLPPWSMGVVGLAKLALAVALIVGIWFPQVAVYAAIGMAVLMAGAVAMHLRVGDRLRKSVPALTLLVMSLLVAAS